MKFLCAVLVLVSVLSPSTTVGGGQLSNELADADNAWLEGRYIQALNSYIRILNSSSGEQFVEPIALQTGELFVSEELTSDGRSPRLSPDGRFIVYETGPPRRPVTHIRRTVGDHQLIADLPGTGAAFSRSGRKVAYLKPPASAALNEAQTALEKAPETGQERASAQRALNRLEMKLWSIMLRDLETQQEVELKTGGLLKTALAFGANEETVYFVGGKDGDAERNDIYMTRPGANPVAVTDTPGFKAAPVLSPTGKLMLVSLPGRNPIPAAASNTPQEQGRQGVREPQRGNRIQTGRQQPATPRKFGLLEIGSRKVTVIEGSAPTFSHNDDSVVYVATSGQENTIVVLSPGQGATTVLKTTDRLDAPSFSPDGRRLVYQRMLRHDWEVYLVSRDGKEESRVTRENQHDVLPRFISDGRILAMMGEARHRRAQIYDLTTNTRTHVFHNNLIRTVSPEYAWTATPDGSMVLISAERDGDTISEDRGVYVVHLNRKISKTGLLSRLESNLAAETALDANAQTIYRPISDQVRRLVDQVSLHTIFGYQKRLFDFGSKHITRPGNKGAAQFLFRTYQSFGYKPEFQRFKARQAVDEGRTSNVIARLTGTENPDVVYVVASHFDSSAAGPGADDNTSGTAALLETARVLAKHPLPATVVFASFTGEEAGLLGSREFVRVAQQEQWNVAAALNNDMIGWSNDGRLDSTIRYSNEAIRDIQHSAARMFTKMITYDARYYKSTDAAPFFPAFGDVIGGISSYPILGSPHYHQPHDNLEFINHELVTEATKTTIATLMLLASSPSPVKNLKQTAPGKFTWSPSPEKSVREYVVAYGPAKGPLRHETVSRQEITVNGLRSGDVLMVKAVSASGVDGWDWSNVTIE